MTEDLGVLALELLIPLTLVTLVGWVITGALWIRVAKLEAQAKQEEEAQ